MLPGNNYMKCIFGLFILSGLTLSLCAQEQAQPRAHQADFNWAEFLEDEAKICDKWAGVWEASSKTYRDCSYPQCSELAKQYHTLSLGDAALTSLYRKAASDLPKFDAEPWRNGPQLSALDQDFTDIVEKERVITARYTEVAEAHRAQAAYWQTRAELFSPTGRVGEVAASVYAHLTQNAAAGRAESQAAMMRAKSAEILAAGFRFRAYGYRLGGNEEEARKNDEQARHLDAVSKEATTDATNLWHLAEKIEAQAAAYTGK
jgi:hypothetical protein